MFGEGWFFEEQHSSSTGQKEHIFWIIYIKHFQESTSFGLYILYESLSGKYIFCIIYFILITLADFKNAVSSEGYTTLSAL